MSVDIKTLWVGDLVWVKSLQQRGTVRGRHGSNQAIVQIGETRLHVNGSDLELIPDQSDQSIDPFLLELTKEVPRRHPEWLDFPRNLDLHLEVLNPELAHASPSRALTFQIAQAKKYLDQAIRLKLPSVVIIHGKGTGVLKMELEHLLGAFPAIRHFHAINEGGALEIWFDHHRNS
ncbi:MAG: Smr/MutS family protein [Saprospiraceae bacterium]|nr:Smr/MutS family protein [Saprospiraceae bacterium]MCB9321265.1 Smr/MutS family protein [Lewinellaceae bacterium]